VRTKVTDSAEGFRRFSSTKGLAKNWRDETQYQLLFGYCAAVISWIVMTSPNDLFKKY